MSAAHYKVILMADSRAAVLRDAAEYSESHPIDGPVVSDYDMAAGMYLAVFFILSDEVPDPPYHFIEAAEWDPEPVVDHGAIVSSSQA